VKGEWRGDVNREWDGDRKVMRKGEMEGKGGGRKGEWIGTEIGMAKRMGKVKMREKE
jgi:hypothetical protein